MSLTDYIVSVGQSNMNKIVDIYLCLVTGSTKPFTTHKSDVDGRVVATTLEVLSSVSK